MIANPVEVERRVLDPSPFINLDCKDYRQGSKDRLSHLHILTRLKEAKLATKERSRREVA
jgi:hypothetical protein